MEEENTQWVAKHVLESLGRVHNITFSMLPLSFAVIRVGSYLPYYAVFFITARAPSCSTFS